jgi:hypothetical protein
LESSRKTTNNPSGVGQYQHLNRDLRSSLNDQIGPSPIGLQSTYSALDNPPKIYSLHQQTPDLQLDTNLFTKKVIDLKTIFSRQVKDDSRGDLARYVTEGASSPEWKGNNYESQRESQQKKEAEPWSKSPTLVEAKFH